MKKWFSAKYPPCHRVQKDVASQPGPCRRGAFCISILAALLVLAFFPLVLIPANARAAIVKLAWDANSEPDLAGYHIYQGTASGNYAASTDVGNTTVCTLSGLSPGVTYYFAATAYDSQGNESGFSNEVAYTVPAVDTDGDGVPDDQDAFPLDASETLDTDGDGVGNNADTDDDNDGMPDAWESRYGLDPLHNDAADDTDGDGLSNLDEYLGGSLPDVADNNTAPDAPALTAPTGGNYVDLTPVLATDNFYDPDPADVHTATQWQIYRQADDTCVFDVKTAACLTALKVPRLVLEENSDYYWRARFFDNHGTASEWSAPAFFVTDFNAEDADGNGIPDQQEVAPSTDLDKDHTPDVNQDNIKSVRLEGLASEVGVSRRADSGILAILAVESEDPGATETSDMSPIFPSELPLGLVNFKLEVDTPGAEVTVTIYFSQKAPQNSRWFKYDPIEKIWTDYTDHVQFSPNRQSVTVTLKDGGFGDQDGIANGIILDPSGAGVADGGSSGGSNNDEWYDSYKDFSCFIATAASGPGFNLWQAVRGRELALIFGLMLLVVAGRAIAAKIKERRGEYRIDPRHFMRNAIDS